MQIPEKVVQTCSEFEDTYIDAVAAIRDSLNGILNVQPKQKSNKESTPLPIPIPVHTIPLPEVKLPTFNDNHIEWPSFKEIYLDRIHQNENLNDLQKFHYLKAAFNGDAAQDILDISALLGKTI